MPIKTVMVFGGGGAVGVAYHCGAVRALQEITGLDPRDVDLLIGTSSGAIVAAEFALGRTVEDIVIEVLSEEEASTGRGLEPAWRSRADLARRAVGSSYLVVRSTLGRGWPVPAAPRWVRRALPGALYAVDGGAWGAVRYPDEWPAQALWVVAADVDRGGRRVVLDREATSGVDAALGTAVMASCAVPGVLAPVRVGGRRLVDGGLRSPSNLGVARRAEADLVIALAPMAFEPEPPPGRMHALGRGRFNARLEKEAASIRAQGTRLLVLRPGADELRHHSSNIMSRANSEAVMTATYEATMARRAEIAALVEGDGARERTA